VAVYFESDAVSSPLRGGHSGRASAHKGIENRVANETEHADKPFGELDRIGRRVLFCGSARDTTPDLLKPFLVIFHGDHAQDFRGNVRSTIAAGLPFHQNEFNVIFYYGIWFVGLAKERRTAFDLVCGVGYLVPDDGREVIEAQLSAVLLDGRMEGHNGVPPAVFSSREADVADYADQSTAGD